jgi:multidrug efflux pump subunit AcrB
VRPRRSARARRDGVPTLTIQADVTQGASPEAAVGNLAPAIAKLAADLPKGYHIAVGGTVEESGTRDGVLKSPCDLHRR